MVCSTNMSDPEWIPWEYVAERPGIISCSYLISSVYGAAPRYVYYLCLGFVLGALVALENPKFLWAVKGHPTSDFLHLLTAGVAATAMIFSATTALHAWILLLDGGWNPQVADMDIKATRYLLIVGLLVSEPLIRTSVVRNSKTRPVVVLWQIWIFFGVLVCIAFTLVSLQMKEPNYVRHPVCYASNGTVVNPPTQFQSLKPDRVGCNSAYDVRVYNCTRDVCNSVSRIRDKSALFIDDGKVFDVHGDTYNISVMYCAAAAILLAFGQRIYTMTIRAVFWFRNKDMPLQSPYPIFLQKDKRLGRCIQILGWAFFVCLSGVSIVLGEVNLWWSDSENYNGENLIEPFKAVGQWSSLVSLALVVLVSLLNFLILEPLHDPDSKVSLRVSRLRRGKFSIVYELLATLLDVSPESQRVLPATTSQISMRPMLTPNASSTSIYSQCYDPGQNTPASTSRAAPS